MVIVALVGALVFYVGLYLLWESTQVRLDSVEAVLRALNKMMWMPENLVFFIFRGLLLVAILYVVADLLIAAAKRATRRRDDAEANALSWKKPPRP